MAHVFGVGNQVKCAGPDDHARGQVADHRAESQSLGQWYGNHSGQQEHNYNLQDAARFMHGGVPERGWMVGKARSAP
ncbi:hypothetical protein GCM10007421_10140 [Halopseudomonas oceani]|nr:hypothetical protein GCM10007421_10140 [Halopseudomonas oceani]